MNMTHMTIVVERWTGSGIWGRAFVRGRSGLPTSWFVGASEIKPGASPFEKNDAIISRAIARRPRRPRAVVLYGGAYPPGMKGPKRS